VCSIEGDTCVPVIATRSGCAILPRPTPSASAGRGERAVHGLRAPLGRSRESLAHRRQRRLRRRHQVLGHGASS
jgi:hypothetical protein